MRGDAGKIVAALGIFAFFEAVAVALWLARDNLFYLFNFSYIASATSATRAAQACA